MLIAPSLLAADFLHLAKEVETVNAHADLFHLDIMDGTFVPNISFGFPVVEAVAREARKPMDVHLMIVHPEKYVERFAKVGASMISFHYEAAMDESDAVIDLIHSFGVQAGIVINPDVPVEKIFPYLGKVDYVLLFTFLCFFIFSSSIAANEGISKFLGKAVSGNEYWWSIGLSQFISNVPASIVLYPFTTNFAGLIYGADTAGLVSLIGSLASVINYRIYVREYPGQGGKFVKVFTLVSWAFFAIVVIPGFLLSRWSFF
jgi:ribulose-phosphate 3-epimerase